MKKQRTFKHLSRRKRIEIETLLNKKISVKEIAETIGVHISTVYREIKRGEFLCKKVKTNYYNYSEKTEYFEKSYSSDLAQERYEKNMTSHGVGIKLGKDYRLAEYIESRIVDDGLTPLAVIGEIRKNNIPFDTSICVRTLYSYIHKDVFLRLSMKHLPFASNKRKRKEKVTKTIPKGLSIEKRPDLSERLEFGHWEMDCVVGKRDKSHLLLCLSERLSRKELIYRIKTKTCDSVIQCLNTLERKYKKLFPKIFKTITVDNGSEFCDNEAMEKSIYGKRKRTTIYHCHPYCSSERGTNERLNREIRRKFPKGTDFDKISNKAVSETEKWLNNYPRGVLGYDTPENVFNYQLNRILSVL